MAARPLPIDLARASPLHRGRNTELLAARMGPYEVVVKRPRTDRGADTRTPERLRREAGLLRAIASPHVIALVGVVELDGAPALVLPRYDGCFRQATPEDIGSRGGILAVAAATAHGLAAIHAQNVLHRDLHPGNVLHAAGRPIVLADLSHAHTRGLAPLTPEGHTVGTAGYIAPEVLRGDPASPASDVYAWAVTLFELITAQRPFEHPDPLVEMARAQREHPFPLRSYVHRFLVPDELEELIDSALAPAPEARPPVEDLIATCVAVAT